MRWIPAVSALACLVGVASMLRLGAHAPLDERPAARPARPLAEPRPHEPYAASRYDLVTQRTLLVGMRAVGVDVTEPARDALRDSLRDLAGHWVGTPYAFTGASDQPHEGRVACGYFVAAVLSHAGFLVDRVDLAEQASEHIVRTLVPEDGVRRFVGASRSAVVDAVEAEGPGVYLVGLDTHVGFLVVDEDAPAELCHATSRGNRGVVCEGAVTSPSLVSEYVVVGRVDNPWAIDAWLDGEALPTAGAPDRGA